MHLPLHELDELRAVIGHEFVRVFCPPPAIWTHHTETSSYSLWLNNAPDFVTVYAIELSQYRFRIAVERGSAPREFPFDSAMNAVRDCSDIWLDARFIVEAIEILCEGDTDKGLTFRDGAGAGFAVITNDMIDEVCFYRLPLPSSYTFSHQTRTTISR